MQEIIRISNQFELGNILNISEIETGLINQTHLIETERERGFNKFVLQKLHNQIGKEVIIDIYKITKHLSNKGFLTPTLVKTKNGGLFVEVDNEIWRMLTYVEGKTLNKIEEKEQAQSAGVIIGKFHSSLLDCDHTFLHKIINFHNTGHIISYMKHAIFKHKKDSKFMELNEMSEYVYAEYNKIKGSLDHLPDRIIHGDPKLSNIIFDSNSNEAISLIDLDTLGRDKIAIDLGDALRSMCNKDNTFDLETFAYFIDGYFSEASFLTKAETQSIANGIQTIILELTARYITDAIEQSYFRLDDSNFPNLYTQNKIKATYNIELYKDFVSKKEIINRTTISY